MSGRESGKDGRAGKNWKRLVAGIVVVIIVIISIFGVVSAVSVDENGYELIWYDTHNSTDPVLDIAWKPSSDSVAVTYGHTGGPIYFFDALTGEKTKFEHNLTIPEGNPKGSYITQFTASSWSPIDENIFVVSNEYGTVMVYNLTDMEWEFVHYSDWTPVTDLAFSPSGDRLAFPTHVEIPHGSIWGNNWSTIGGPIEIVNTSTMETISLINLYALNEDLYADYNINSSLDYVSNKIFWSPDGSKIATVTSGGTVLVSDTLPLIDNVTRPHTLHNIVELENLKDAREIAWSPDSEVIAAVHNLKNGWDNASKIGLWDAGTGNLLREKEIEEITWFMALDWSSQNMIYLNGVHGENSNYTGSVFMAIDPDNLSANYRYDDKRFDNYQTQGAISVSPDGTMVCASFGNKVAMFIPSEPDVEEAILYSTTGFGAPLIFGLALFVNSRNNRRGEKDIQVQTKRE